MKSISLLVGTSLLFLFGNCWLEIQHLGRNAHGFTVAGLQASLLHLPDKTAEIQLSIDRTFTVDSLGACQGVSYQDGFAYLYGDREVGVMRQYQVDESELKYTGREVRFTEKRKNVINHPTGIARHAGLPTFIGNTIRLNQAGTDWKAMIYAVDWEGLLRDGTLDGHIVNTVEDDACIQGTRPEYVRVGEEWWVATADYGNQRNEVRLYDPQRLRTAQRTSEPGVVHRKFSCGPWVQNLHWIDDQGVLVLVQNQHEGKRWRFTFLDLAQSLQTGRAAVRKQIDIDRKDELEGFTLAGSTRQGVAVTAHRKDNVSLVRIDWE